MISEGKKLFSVAMRSSANAFVVFGGSQTMAVMRTLIHFFAFENVPGKTKVWIMTAEVEFTSVGFQRGWSIQYIHGAISLSVPSKNLLRFQEFMQMRNPTVDNEDGFIKDFWGNAFACSFPEHVEEEYVEQICSGSEKLENLPKAVFEMTMTDHSHSVYNAVYAVAYALHAMHLHRFKQSVMGDQERQKLLNQKQFLLHLFLAGVSFNNSAGEKVAFNHNGELIAGFDIINWVTFPNQSFLRVKVGKIDPGALSDKVLTINEEAIIWPSRFNQTLPLSLCNEPCLSGQSKTKKEGKPFCCYDCIPCPQGKITNQTAAMCDRGSIRSDPPSMGLSPIPPSAAQRQPGRSPPPCGSTTTCCGWGRQRATNRRLQHGIPDVLWPEEALLRDGPIAPHREAETR
uniref:Uncharacterized protein n=1 Tax=Sphaerodactylus townsendi TaxID=933632 RepID=A0ACB8FTW6_9SAUR